MPERAAQRGKFVLKPNSHCPPAQEINILLLGQAGVGKSTFINAFANYLNNDTLDEALNDELQVIIPSSFSFTDPETFDERMIVIGKEDEYEQFKNVGQSNTQQCRSFVFPIGNRNLRFIDTPGMGDTRGLQKDGENFREILTYIAQYEHLNAVFIMLKPNEERLNILFRFSVNELLRHLHVSVKENLVFVFTNARSTFFMPGSTKKILQGLLYDHREKHHVEVPFSKDNTFLFDSEPFRYLALCKNGVRFDNEHIQSYTKSWDHSVKEYSRLMEHIATRPLHPISNTLSLNEAEQLIRKLPRPLAETARLIEENIQLAKEHEKKVLENPQIASQGIPQNDAVVVLLQHPRTVCTDKKCCRVIEVNSGRIVEYLSICHDRCYLKVVAQETLAYPELTECEAMDPNNGSCLVCGCSWEKHKHITYECNTRRTNAKSNATGNSKTNKEMSLSEIDKRISDLRAEERQIQDIYKQLARFLDANSILPINDGYIDYLQYFIREEQMKHNAGDHNTEVIAGLEKLMTDYNNEMGLFKRTLQNQRDAGEEIEELKSEDVFRLVGDLYRLPISGNQIREQVAVMEISQKRYNAQHEKFVELPAKAASSASMLRLLPSFQIHKSSDTVPVMFSAAASISLSVASSDTVPIMFSVEASISLPVDLDSDILQLEKCTTCEELDSATSQLNSDCCFLVVSQKKASDELLSNTQLLRYYFFIPSDKLVQMKSKEHVKITYVSSVSHLFDELCNDLSQYYHDAAHRALNKQGNRIKAKRLLTKSTKCREILMGETEKRLKHYADILTPQSLDKQEPVTTKTQ